MKPKGENGRVEYTEPVPEPEEERDVTVTAAQELSGIHFDYLRAKGDKLVCGCFAVTNDGESPQTVAPDTWCGTADGLAAGEYACIPFQGDALVTLKVASDGKLSLSGEITVPQVGAWGAAIAGAL